MRRLALVSTLISLLIVVGTTVPAEAIGRDATDPAGALVLPHRIAPQLGQDAAGDETLVTGVPDGQGRLAQILVRERSAGGGWGPDQVLASTTKGLTDPTLAVAANGVAFVGWTDWDHGGSYARIRDTSGVWGPTSQLPRIDAFTGLQAVINSTGDTVAVAPGQFSGSRHIAVYRHGTWTDTVCPNQTTPSIGVDDAGRVYAASSDFYRDGLGWVDLARQSPSGRWSPATRLRDVGQHPYSVDLHVTPSGQLTVLVGYGDRRWRSPSIDSEFFVPTAYVVLRRSHWRAPLRQVWSRQGVRDVDARLTSDGALMMAFLQWSHPVGHCLQGYRPSRIALRTVVIGRHHQTGHVITLDRQPAARFTGYYLTTTSLVPSSSGSGRRLLTWWQYLPVTKNIYADPPAGDLSVATTTTKRALGRATLPGTGADHSEWSGSGVTVTSAAGLDAAWVRSISYRPTPDSPDSFDVVDGTVVVGSAPLG